MEMDQACDQEAPQPGQEVILPWEKLPHATEDSQQQQHQQPLQQAAKTDDEGGTAQGIPRCAGPDCLFQAYKRDAVKAAQGPSLGRAGRVMFGVQISPGRKTRYLPTLGHGSPFVPPVPKLTWMAYVGAARACWTSTPNTTRLGRSWR